MTAPYLTLATSRERPAVKACATCRRVPNGPYVGCSLYVLERLADVEDASRAYCGGAGWLPRRSLRQWFIDTVWKVEGRR